MPLYFDEFGDLSADWPMILVGWRGFARRELSAKQVIALALEQVGRGIAEQDEIAALLANTDPNDWQTIDRYLEQIAGEERFDRATAVRRWRLAELKCLLQTFPRLDRVCKYPEDEPLRVFDDFVDFWGEYDELPDSATAQPKGVSSVKDMLAEQQAWIEHEEAVLRSKGGASVSP